VRSAHGDGCPAYQYICFVFVIDLLYVLAMLTVIALAVSFALQVASMHNSVSCGCMVALLLQLLSFHP